MSSEDKKALSLLAWLSPLDPVRKGKAPWLPLACRATASQVGRSFHGKRKGSDACIGVFCSSDRLGLLKPSEF